MLTLMPLQPEGGIHRYAVIVELYTDNWNRNG